MFSARNAPLLAAALAILACGCAARSPVDSSELLTLERLHGSGEFRQEDFGQVRWLEDGTGYTALERGDTGGREIVFYRPDSGSREVLVPASALTPAGESEPLSIADYTWSADSTKLLIFTNTRRVWRSNSRGDYWVLDRQGGTLEKLGGEFESSRLQFAKFSPSGDRVAYVYENDIYVEELESGTITRLTDDGTEKRINGTFDWVYEEEWSLRDGFRWSPDGRRIAFWQIDSEGVREFTLIDNTAGLYPSLKRFPYPKVGETNPGCRIGVVPSGGGETLWLQVPGEERDRYIARMEWAASSEEVVIQHVNRLQNTIRVLLGDARSGAAREVFVDREETWAEVCDDLRWLDDGGSFTWISERDGWRHIYVVSRDGQVVRLVTPGEYDVIGIVRIDEPGGFAYFIASPDDPTQRFLYRVPLVGGAAPERLTPTGETGSHGYQVSHDARFAIHTHSSFGVPPVIDLVELPDHDLVRTFEDNTELRGKLDGLRRGPEEFFRVEIGDGVEIDGWCMKPPGFDPRKKYPLLVYVYGEPAGSTVRDVWDGGTYLWHLLLAQKGYVVVSLDNRGTPAPRGRAWRKSIYRQIGILAAEDQAAALRALEERWPYIDRSRVGIWGWSGGGSMSLNAIFRYPDLYQTAIAIAFVADQRFYDTIYQERYMGLPIDNPDGFRDGSPITHARNLEGNLLLVYGTGDDNCHYQNCEALVNELIEHDRPFTMMAYPNRTHGIHEGKNTRKHLYTMMARFLEENLPPGTNAAE